MGLNGGCHVSIKPPTPRLLDGNPLQVGALKVKDEAGYGSVVLLGIDRGEARLLDVGQHVAVEATPVVDEGPHPTKHVLQLPPQPMVFQVELGNVLHEVEFATL